MKVVCAWCNKDMGEKEPTKGRQRNEVTHGMCDKCYKKQMGG